jgi:hypothetical protein
LDESKLVGSLFDGSGKEGVDVSDPDGVAAEELVAGAAREGRRKKKVREKQKRR